MMALFVLRSNHLRRPEAYRIWVACGLGVFYLLGILALWSRIKKLLQNQPFPETIGQIKKDWECLTRRSRRISRTETTSRRGERFESAGANVRVLSLARVGGKG